MCQRPGSQVGVTCAASVWIRPADELRCYPLHTQLQRQHRQLVMFVDMGSWWDQTDMDGVNSSDVQGGANESPHKYNSVGERVLWEVELAYVNSTPDAARRAVRGSVPFGFPMSLLSIVFSCCQPDRSNPWEFSDVQTIYSGERVLPYIKQVIRPSWRKSSTAAYYSVGAIARVTSKKSFSFVLQPQWPPTSVALYLHGATENTQVLFGLIQCGVSDHTGKLLADNCVMRYMQRDEQGGPMFQSPRTHHWPTKTPVRIRIVVRDTQGQPTLRLGESVYVLLRTIEVPEWKK
jgi:hypothetical protein